MKRVILLSYLGIFGIATVSGENETSAYSSNVENWAEVPESVFEKIVTDPTFSKTCHWRVLLEGGIVNAKPLDENNPVFFLSLPFGQQGLKPGATIAVPGGWLAAYHKEFSEPHESIEGIYWIAEDTREKQLIHESRVKQFYLDQDSGEIYAGSDSGIIRFSRVGTEWICKKIVNFQFSRVYGITSNSKGGLLVFSRSGWWEVGEDNEVTQYRSIDGLELSGLSICKKDNFVFLGGGLFVTKVSIDDRKVSRLSPSLDFLRAMRTMNDQEFEKYLVDQTSIELSKDRVQE